MIKESEETVSSETKRKRNKMNNDEKVYDHFSFTIAYVENGQMALENATRVVLVKKGSNFATNENREKVLKDIEEYVFEDSCDDPYYRDFQSIYRGCKRMLHIEGQKPRVLKQTSPMDLRKFRLK
jgi:hypothetical protein